MPDGKAAANAQVFLCNPKRGVVIHNGKNVGTDEALMTTTGLDGRFSFPPQSGTFSVVVLHQAGFQEVTASQLAAQSSVRLMPWGRLDGQLLVRGRPVSEGTIELRSLRSRSRNKPRLVFAALQTNSAEEGRFSFERLPPGSYQAVRKTKVADQWIDCGTRSNVSVESGKGHDRSARRDRLFGRRKFFRSA